MSIADESVVPHRHPSEVPDLPGDDLLADVDPFDEAELSTLADEILGYPGDSV